ncbi:MAG: M20 family peptidase, partial [Veillonella nakazawae]
MILQEREARACAIIDSMTEELRDISSYLHDNPELGLNEHKAVKIIYQFLENHNFTSQVGLTDYPELQTALRGDHNHDAKHKIAFLG